RPPSSSSTRLLTRRPATRTSPTSSAQSAPSLQKQPYDTIRLPCSHRPRIRRRLCRTPPPHARIHLDHPDRPHLQEPSMNYARLFATMLEFIHEYDLPQPMSVNAFLGHDEYNAVTLITNGRNGAPISASAEALCEHRVNDIATASIMYDGANIPLQIYDEDTNA